MKEYVYNAADFLTNKGTMEWVVVHNRLPVVEEYHLTNNGEDILTLKYNTHQKVARLTSGQRHDVYFIEKTGVFQPKILFRNAYGQEIGRVLSEKWQQSMEHIEFAGRKYHYHIQNDPLAELVVYDDERPAPIARCKVMTGADPRPVVLDSLRTQHFLPLIVSLCWFTSPETPAQIPVKKLETASR